MTIDHNTLLFFDASCLVAAAGSSQGGSGFLLSLCSRGFLRTAVSEAVLVEAQRHILEYLGMVGLTQHDEVMDSIAKTVMPVPSMEERERVRGLVTVKDEHVLASALAAQADYLITLDKQLAIQVNQANLGLSALAPGDFIKTMLPQHPDFPRVRE